MNIRELLERRAGLISQARGILDTAEGEDRGLSQEEQNQYDALWKDVQDLTERIQRAEQQSEAERAMAEPYEQGTRPAPDDGDGDEDREAPRPEFRSRGMVSMGEDLDLEPVERLLTPEYQRAFRSWLRRKPGKRLGEEEERALQADADIYGGYLYAPVQFVDSLIAAVDDLVYIRQWATVYAVTDGESLGAPSLDNDPADPTWTSELLIGSEDSTLSIGKRELNPHPLAKYLKVSRKLMRKVPSVEGLVRARLAYKFSVVAENAYQNGSGANQPLGVFTASDDGISTGRDVSTGNTTTEIQFDGLIEAKYTLKPQYWPKARWVFHRDGQKQVAKLKDGNGQYLWRESVRVGEPDRVLGFPTFMSEYAPNTFTTGLYVGLLGDFSFYWIADSLQMEMQRLDELFAATNQVGFVGRLESDGMPVLEEAFVRVTLA